MLLTSLSQPGVIAGLLAARHLAPALVWGGIGESDRFRPDSGAASWAERKMVHYDRYVAKMAALATGRAGPASDGDERESSQNSTGESGSEVSALQRTLSKHSVGALKVCCLLFVSFCLAVSCFSGFDVYVTGLWCGGGGGRRTRLLLALVS